MGLLYLQDQDVVGASTATVTSSTGTLTSSTTTIDNRKMGVILETALQRAPLVLIKAGKLQGMNENVDRACFSIFQI